MTSKQPAKGTYQNYKGDFVEVLGVASDPESGQRFVVYESLGITEILDEDEGEPQLGHRVVRNGSKGALSVCTLDRFTGVVDPGEGAGGKPVPRFRLIARRPAD